MREILFRGKRKSDNTWVEGDYLRIQTSPETTLVSCINTGEELGHYYGVDPETIGQLVFRLFNKDGSKGQGIFEGDIVRFTFQEEFSCAPAVFEADSSFTGVICVEDGCIWVRETPTQTTVSLWELLFDAETDIEIIGNRFDTMTGWF